MLEIDKKEDKIIYAGFWIRFNAFALDIIIVNILYAIYLFFFGHNIRGFFDSSLSFLFLWGYFASLECSPKQATFGKMALGIKVTDLSGNRISYAKASGRFWGRILSHLVLGFGYLMIPFTKRKQSLHDKLANCLVVKKTPIKDSKGKITLIALSGLVLFSFIIFANSLVLYRFNELRYPPVKNFISKKLGLKSINDEIQENMSVMKRVVHSYKWNYGYFPKNSNITCCSTKISNIENPISGTKGEGYAYMCGKADKVGIVGYESDEDGEIYKITGYSYNELVDTIFEPKFWGEIKYIPYTTNLRASHSTKARIIDKLESGQKIKVAFFEDNWYTVFKAENEVPSKSGKLGYVYAPILRDNPPYDFRKTKWGMSEGEVIRLEKNLLLSIDRTDVAKFLIYKGKLAEMNCEIWYMFVKNRLIKGGYDFTAFDTYKVYWELSNILSEKYGEYETSGLNYRGWYTSTTYIELQCKTSENRVIILYVSRRLGDLKEEVEKEKEEAKRRKALGEL